MGHESSSEKDGWILSSMEQYLECGVFGEGVDHGELVRSDVRQSTVIPDEDSQVTVGKVLNVLFVCPSDLLVSMMTSQSHKSVPATWIVFFHQQAAERKHVLDRKTRVLSGCETRGQVTTLCLVERRPGALVTTDWPPTLATQATSRPLETHQTGGLMLTRTVH